MAVDKGIFRRTRCLALAAAVACALLSGCRSEPKQAKSTIFAMDTVMTLTICGTDQAACQQTLDQAVERIYQLERTLSVTSQDSDVYAVNHAGGAWTEVAQETQEVLERAVYLCGATQGALDITAYPAVLAWGFTSGEYRVPDRQELERLSARIDYAKLELDPAGGLVRLPGEMALDLGAVTKGYTGDVLARLVEQARDSGVTCAILDLGQSSIQTVGTKADGTPWRIGIQDPAGEGYLGVLEVTDQAVGTSGGYQRYFEADGQRYWHIIDPGTAAPARSGLAGVTVVSGSGLDCDGLSTALFVMGLEDGADFWRTHPELNFEAIFVSDDGAVSITAGLEDSFSLTQNYETREVTVLQ